MHSPVRTRFLLPSFAIGRSVAIGSLVVDAVVLVTIVQHSDWMHRGIESIEALGVFSAFMLLIPIGLFTSLNWQQRAVALAGSISDHDVSHAPVSLLQAGMDGALQPGEQLNISRKIQFSKMRLLLSLICSDILFGIALVALLYRSHAVTFLPAPGSWGTSLMLLPPLVIVTLILPFLLVGMAFLPSVLSGSWQRFLIIQADDEGLTVQQSGVRASTLRWDEITYIVYAPARKAWPFLPEPFDGMYVIGNSQRFITFKTWYGVGLALQSNPTIEYQFAPNIFEFLSSVERILATIRAKQAIELRVPERQFVQTQALAQKWEEDHATNDADIAEVRVVHALIQPRADLVALMEHSQETIMLRPRLNPAQIFRNIRMFSIMSLALFAPWMVIEALANGIFHAHDKYNILFQTPLAGVISSACLGGFIVLVSSWVGWKQTREERVTIIADAHGITKKQHRKKDVTVAWSTISQWEMEIRRAKHAQVIHYSISGRSYISWNESPTDSLAATKVGVKETFQQRAEKLHAMIAAQTKLPLIERPYEPRKRSWWQKLLF